MYAAAAQGLLGLVQTAVSASQASKLPQDKKYEPSEELKLAYNMARRRADEGYSPEEKAAFEQALARQGTATKTMLQNVGLAGVGSAAESIMGIDALNRFSAEGANVRRQNFGQFAGLASQIQDIDNMEISRSNQQLNMQRQALGQATQAGLSNMLGAVNAGQNYYKTDKAMDIYQNMGQQNTQEQSGLLEQLKLLQSSFQPQGEQQYVSPLEGYPGFDALNK